jgi:hypothetical protein
MYTELLRHADRGEPNPADPGELRLPAGVDGTQYGSFGRKDRRNPAMRMRVLLEPHHGASYDQILALAQATEEAGFDALFRSPTT